MAENNRVAIVGVGYSTVGRGTGLSLQALTAQAAVAAMKDAGIGPGDIDGVATHSFPHQYTSATDTADLLGIPDVAWYSGSIDGAAYSVAALHGIAAVASGSCHTCLTIRTMHQRAGASPTVDDPSINEAYDDQQFLQPFGAMTGAHFAGVYMQRYMHEYGIPEEHFGALAIAQRDYAAKNPDAVFRNPLTMDDYLNARFITKPLRLLDCDIPVDSGSALIFTTEERARDMAKKPVFFESWAMGTTDVSNFFLVEDMTETSPYRAAQTMWDRTSLTPADVDVAGLYDGFTFITLQWLEALGFCGKGEGGAFVAEGNTRPDGIIPTNTDGGACNVGRRHGANFFIETTRQLRGEADIRQIPDAKVAVVSNSVGGFANCALLTSE